LNSSIAARISRSAVRSSISLLRLTVNLTTGIEIPARTVSVTQTITSSTRV